MIQPKAFWPALPGVLLMMSTIASLFLPRLGTGPMLLAMASDFGVSYGTVSNAFVAVSAGFVVAILGSGFVTHLVRHRWTVVIAAAIGGGGAMWVAFAPSLQAAYVGFVFLGAGAGLYSPSGLAVIREIVIPADQGKAVGIHELGPNIAFILAPLVVSTIVPRSDWRTAMMVMAAVPLAVSVLLIFFGRFGWGQGERPLPRNMMEVIRDRSFWILTLSFILAAVGSLGVFSIMPTYLQIRRLYSLEAANSLVAVSRILTLGMVFATGLLLDHFGVRRVMGSMLMLSAASAAGIALAGGSLLPPLVVLQAMFASAIIPGILAGAGRIGAEKLYNIRISLIIPAANLLGGGVAPRLLAALGEANRFELGFLITGALMLAGAAAVLALDPVVDQAGDR